MKKIFRSIDNNFYRKNKFINLYNPNQLLNKSNNSGNLISSAALSSAVTFASGDSITLRMSLQLKDCP